MDHKTVIKICKDIGCCDACCVRYCGLRKPTVFTNVRQFMDDNADDKGSKSDSTDVTTDASEKSESSEANGTPAKKRKCNDICVVCLGILQEDAWPECFTMAKEILDKKKYDTNTFACALSAPIATIVREKAVVLKLGDMCPAFDMDTVTPIKEAWKWSFGQQLAIHLEKTLDSGATTPLMVTLNMEYADDGQECEVFEPSPDQLRRRQRKQRCNVPITRCLVDRALDNIPLQALHKLCKWESGIPLPKSKARCVSVEATHAPVYLGGRYIKLSRELSQSPWVLNGKRMMESSVQEIIFQPIADIYGLSLEDAEHRMKFLSAGREDVDVRCLGEGRPFAIEISDPRRTLTGEELSKACEEISKSGKVVVCSLVPVTREKLAELKKGEESKYKTYEALCVKLSHTAEDIAEGATPTSPIAVHTRDISRIVSFKCPAHVLQRTPLRVLHRRSMLQRTRDVLHLSAAALPDHPQLFTVQVQTEAGTYIKEWVHGELGRTKPSLRDVIGARTDILALDVTSVQLPWP